MEKRNSFGVRIAFAVLGIVSGVSIFVSFAVLKNFNAAIWGLLSAIFAAVVLRLHIGHRKDNFLSVFSQKTLRLLKQFAAFGSYASILAAITYITLGIVLKQGYKLENDGYMPAGIFSLLAFKWAAFLFCHCKNYDELYFSNSESKPIANDEPTSKAEI